MNEKLLKHFNDIDELVFCTFRYYLGRRTIAACQFARDLAKAWDDIEETTRKLIQKELTDAFEDDDEYRQRVKRGEAVMCLPLGDDCDREAWEEVRKKFN
jgi:hypothetical protein